MFKSLGKCEKCNEDVYFHFMSYDKEKSLFLCLSCKAKEPTKPNHWIVNVKGEADSFFEISVIRADNSHGIASYGWFGKNKILISSSGGPCDYTVPKIVFDGLVKVAEKAAKKLNAKETKNNDEVNNGSI